MNISPVLRGLSTEFLDALDALVDDTAGQWWRDVLAHPDLILAVRLESLNVYHRGASLFRIRMRQGRLVPETHVKYLVRRRQALAELQADSSFDVDAAAVLWQRYGPDTLAEIIAAADALSGPEKSLLHPLVQASPNVIDVEIAVTGEMRGLEEPDEPVTPDPLLADLEPLSTPLASKGPRQDRIDVASLETRGDPKSAWLVFHEAKHFANPALRAAPKKRPAVLNQLGRYRSSIGQNSGNLSYSYPFVCHALVRLDAMRRRVRTRHPLWAARPQPVLDLVIQEVADGRRRLRVDDIPRLVVFGFDADQRDGAWSSMRQRLEQEHGTIVYAVGKPISAKPSPAFQPPKSVLDAHAAALAAKAAEPPPIPPAPIIKVPAGCPGELCLHFGAAAGEVLPVYFVNAGSTALTDVSTTIGSPIGDPMSPITPRKLDQNGGAVQAGTGVLIGLYGVFWDGDVLTDYEIAFTDTEGARHRVQTCIGAGGSPPRWVKLKPMAKTAASTPDV